VVFVAEHSLRIHLSEYNVNPTTMLIPAMERLEIFGFVLLCSASDMKGLGDQVLLELE